ncbi:olfactory receptor 8S1-like [Hipposideros larvatus]
MWESSGTFSLGFLDTLINILLAISLDFCGDQSIPHYSCELPSLFPLSCSDVSTNFTVPLCSSLLHALGTYVLIVYSHTLIVSTIPSTSSFSGRSKIFSMCSSHLTAVLLFCGAAFLSYLVQNSVSPLEFITSAQGSVLSPLVNSLIYSLKSNAVNVAMRRTFRTYLQYFR